jgi:hypothetical protein
MTRSPTAIRWTSPALVAVIIGLVTAGAFLFRGYLVPILPTAASSRDALRSLSVPPGFVIEVFAADVHGARSLALSPSGTLFVGTRREGKVYAVLDLDKDMVADRVTIIASGLRMPNGVAFRNGDLYVAEVSRVLRFSDVEEDLSGRQEPTVVTAAYPSDEHHGWKFIAFGPDGLLYVPVGAPCNVCTKDEETYALITRMDPDTGERQLVAKGVRNTGASTGTPRPASSGLPITAATGWATTARRTSSTGRRKPVCISAFHSVTAVTSPTPNSATGATAANSRHPFWSWVPTSPRSACVSTPPTNFPSATVAASSSPSTARGTARPRSAIA